MASRSMRIKKEGVAGLLPRPSGTLLQRDEFGKAGDAARLRSAFLLNYIDLSPHPSERNNALRPHGHRSTAGELGRTWRAHHVAVVRRSCIRFDDPQGKRLFLCAMECGENKPGSRRKHCRSNTSSSAASRGSHPGEDRSPSSPLKQNVPRSSPWGRSTCSCPE